MLKHSIRGVPGTYNGKITALRIMRLVGKESSELAVARPRRPLKQAAIDAESRLTYLRKRRKINFRCPVPIKTIPPRVRRGFESAMDQNKREEKQVAHYYIAL